MRWRVMYLFSWCNQSESNFNNLLDRIWKVQGFPVVNIAFCRYFSGAGKEFGKLALYFLARSFPFIFLSEFEGPHLSCEFLKILPTPYIPAFYELKLRVISRLLLSCMLRSHSLPFLLNFTLDWSLIIILC